MPYEKEEPIPLTRIGKNDMIEPYGELSERFKELVLKTSDGATHREFESHTLRQRITATLIQVAFIFFL